MDKWYELKKQGMLVLGSYGLEFYEHDQNLQLPISCDISRTSTLERLLL